MMEVLTLSNQQENASRLPASRILGVRVDRVSMDETISLIRTMARSERPHQIVPVNPEMIVAAQHNQTFKGVLNNASLVLPDGIGVLLASWIQGTPQKSRVTGIDTVIRLAEMAEQDGLKIFLLGAAPGVAERTAAVLQDKHPRLEIVGTYAGSPHPDEELEICRRISEAGPHILLVAFGAPKQELWVARTLHRLQVPVVMCVGGTFDFIAGVSSRAPKILQYIGLEWLYRLLREPRRWRRMLALPRFAAAVIYHRISSIAEQRFGIQL